MNLDTLVNKYYSSHKEYLDFMTDFHNKTVEDYLLSSLYTCLEDSVPIETTVGDGNGNELYTADEAEFVFMSLKDKLESDDDIPF